MRGRAEGPLMIWHQIWGNRLVMITCSCEVSIIRVLLDCEYLGKVMEARRLRSRRRRLGARIQKRRKPLAWQTMSDQTARYQILSGSVETCYCEMAHEARLLGAPPPGRSSKVSLSEAEILFVFAILGFPRSTSVGFQSTRLSSKSL